MHAGGRLGKGRGKAFRENVFCDPRAKPSLCRRVEAHAGGRETSGAGRLIRLHRHSLLPDEVLILLVCERVDRALRRVPAALLRGAASGDRVYGKAAGGFRLPHPLFIHGRRHTDDALKRADEGPASRHQRQLRSLALPRVHRRGRAAGHTGRRKAARDSRRRRDAHFDQSPNDGGRRAGRCRAEAYGRTDSRGVPAGARGRLRGYQHGLNCGASRGYAREVRRIAVAGAGLKPQQRHGPYADAQKGRESVPEPDGASYK